MRCAACGSSLVFSKPHYWVCNGYAKGACGRSQHIRDDLLKEAVIRRLQSDCETDANVTYDLTLQPGDKNSETAALERRRIRTVGKVERLREAFLSGTDTVEEYKGLKLSLQAELDEIDGRLAALQNTEDQSDAADKLKNQIRECMQVLLSSDAAMEQKNDAVSSIVKNCIWDKGKNLLRITYRSVF